MALITRLQVIDLRDKGVITGERALDWLSILDKGGVLDVAQRLVDQAASPESLLPVGVTITRHPVGDNEVEIDFKTVTREGILRLNTAGVLEPEQTVDFLARAREAQVRPSGGGFLDKIRAIFDPTDPRGTFNIGPVTIKPGTIAAGVAPLVAAVGGPALAGTALATGARAAIPAVARAVPAPVARAASTALAPVGRAITGAGSRLAQLTGVSPRSIPRLLATGAVGGGTALAVSGALSDGGPDQPPVAPSQQPPEGSSPEGPSPAAQLVEQIQSDILTRGGTPDDVTEAAKGLGVDVQYITRKVQRFNPATGRIEEVDSIIPIISDTQINPITGQPETVQSAGAPFFPELAQAQFQLEQTEAERQFGLQEQRLAAQERTDLLQALPSLTQFFSLLADPKTANLLRIASARAGGQDKVGGLQLPQQLGALFGLEPGQALPSGVQGGEASGQAGGFLGSIGQILGEASGFQVPELRSQLTPGTARGFSPEELGAAQAAFIGSGTTLEEQQRIARKSALPGGGSFRSR